MGTKLEDLNLKNLKNKTLELEIVTYSPEETRIYEDNFHLNKSESKENRTTKKIIKEFEIKDLLTKVPFDLEIINPKEAKVTKNEKSNKDKSDSKENENLANRHGLEIIGSNIARGIIYEITSSQSPLNEVSSIIPEDFTNEENLRRNYTFSNLQTSTAINFNELITNGLSSLNYTEENDDLKKKYSTLSPENINSSSNINLISAFIKSKISPKAEEIENMHKKVNPENSLTTKILDREKEKRLKISFKNRTEEEFTKASKSLKEVLLSTIKENINNLETTTLYFNVKDYEHTEKNLIAQKNSTEDSVLSNTTHNLISKIETSLIEGNVKLNKINETKKGTVGFEYNIKIIKPKMNTIKLDKNNVEITTISNLISGDKLEEFTTKKGLKKLHLNETNTQSPTYQNLITTTIFKNAQFNNMRNKTTMINEVTNLKTNFFSTPEKELLPELLKENFPLPNISIIHNEILHTMLLSPLELETKSFNALKNNKSSNQEEIKLQTVAIKPFELNKNKIIESEPIKIITKQKNIIENPNPKKNQKKIITTNSSQYNLYTSKKPIIFNITTNSSWDKYLSTKNSNTGTNSNYIKVLLDFSSKI